jgi:hypothetical protein
MPIGIEQCFADKKNKKKQKSFMAWHRKAMLQNYRMNTGFEHFNSSYFDIEVYTFVQQSQQ